MKILNLKNVELNVAELSFIITLLHRNIEYAPDENSNDEIEITTSILNKLIM